MKESRRYFFNIMFWEQFIGIKDREVYPLMIYRKVEYLSKNRLISEYCMRKNKFLNLLLNWVIVSRC